MRIGFIGLGNMAGAIIGGMLKNNILKPEDIIGSDASEAAVKNACGKFGIRASASNTHTVSCCDILVLSVKPQYYQAVIEEVREAAREEQIILTIAPGKTMDWLREQFRKEMKIARCMPNTPALVGEGCTGVCFGEKVSPEERQTILRILSSFGKASEVPETLMDAVVGVSGSAPAYVFIMIEAMADAGVAGGMPRKLAYEFAAQAVMGSARMALETGSHPAELKDMVCSPAGTTIEAVRVLEERGFRSAIIEAIRACIEKSKNI